MSNALLAGLGVLASSAKKARCHGSRLGLGLGTTTMRLPHYGEPGAEKPAAQSRGTSQ